MPVLQAEKTGSLKPCFESFLFVLITPLSIVAESKLPALMEEKLMKSLIRRLFVASLSMLTLSMILTGTGRATTIINTGFNLFETTPVSQFFFDAPIPNPQFVDFEGDPLGTFDFGSGAVPVGTIDTIIERKQLANLGGGSDTIDIEIVALQLRSVAPVDLGLGGGFEDIFIALNADLGSSMTIIDTGEGLPHGTFDSTLHFSFDVIGSVGGFYTTLEKTITATGQEWQHAPTGGPQIDGINHLLNGVDVSNDFWPVGLVIHDDGTGTAIHTARVIPEPGSFMLLIVGLAGLMARSRKSN